MPTYQSIQTEIATSGGTTVKPCWIAHAKELCGLPVRSRRTGPRKHPCPASALPRILGAFRSLGMI